MKTTIVFAHPWDKSFNKKVLDTITHSLDENGDDITLIDLYEDDFNPVMCEEELSIYSQGQSLDPLVYKYLKILNECEKIIFIFPIWWYDMPAIMRGFFDKVMLTGHAYDEDEQGMHPKYDIQKTFIFTTSSAPTKQLVEEFGDPINGPIINGTFKAIGFKNCIWHNLGTMSANSDATRSDFLNTISNAVRK